MGTIHFLDTFSTDVLSSGYRWFDDPPPDAYSLTDGWLMIEAGMGQDLWSDTPPKRGAPLLLRPAPEGDYWVETLVSAYPIGNPSQPVNTQMGLFVFQDVFNWIFFGLTHHDFPGAQGDGLIVTVTEANMSSITPGSERALAEDFVFLRIERLGDEWKFYWKLQHDDLWNLLTTVNLALGDHEVGMGVKTFWINPDRYGPAQAHFDFFLIGQDETKSEPTAFQYAVKFVCGKSAGDIMARGRYFTAINVHNPNQNRIDFKKKFALPGEQAEIPGRFTEFSPVSLDYDEVLEIDCRDIFDHTNSISTAPFRKGFVIIVSDVELDVVAVHTAAGLFGRVKALHIEHVQPSGTHLHNAVPTTDPFATGGFTVDPGETFPALTVPADKVFIMTDVIIFPLVESSNPEFVVRYRIEENTMTKFQYNTVGTATNWSQHFSNGITFAAGSTVNVVNTNFSTGRTGFQLLGYFTAP